MSARPWLSGCWCNPRAEGWSHKRCAGSYAGATCSCTCHHLPAAVEPPAPAPEAWMVHRFTWVEPTGEHRSSARPSDLGRDYNVRAMARMVERGCTDVRLYEAEVKVTDWRETRPRDDA